MQALFPPWGPLMPSPPCTLEISRDAEEPWRHRWVCPAPHGGDEGWGRAEQGLTLVLVLDGEAEDVPGPEAGAVVHAPVEERMGIGILDVEDLPCGGHVPCDALVRGDPDLVALGVLAEGDCSEGLQCHPPPMPP